VNNVLQMNVKYLKKNKIFWPNLMNAGQNMKLGEREVLQKAI
jgi:hypothetical protein